MRSLRRILIDVTIFIAIVGTIIYLYQVYGQSTITYLFGEQTDTIYLGDLAAFVTVADTPEERRQGLSGVEDLSDREGKLFIFDKEGKYGFWMKDMLIPIDIIWVNDDQKIVHIEENVKPESYPAVYNSPYPARFVLEFRAFFVDTFNVEVGDKVTIPAHDLPPDLVERLK